MKKSNKYFIFATITVGCLGRLVPHYPNSTPLTNLSLLCGSKLNKFLSIFIIAATMLISDTLLAFIQHHSILSTSSIFTYSGFLAITIFGSFLKNRRLNNALLYVLISSLVFWLWTNFGVWLMGGIYSKDFNGLLSCYIAALPFLGYAILGDSVWYLVIFGMNELYERFLIKDSAGASLPQ